MISNSKQLLEIGETDALLARVRQHDTSGCSDHDADETNNARVDWLCAIVVGTLVMPAVYYLAPYIAVFREWLG